MKTIFAYPVAHNVRPGDLVIILPDGAWHLWIPRMDYFVDGVYTVHDVAHVGDYITITLEEDNTPGGKLYFRRFKRYNATYYERYTAF